MCVCLRMFRVLFWDVTDTGSLFWDVTDTGSLYWDITDTVRVFYRVAALISGNVLFNVGLHKSDRFYKL